MTPEETLKNMISDNGPRSLLTHEKYAIIAVIGAYETSANERDAARQEAASAQAEAALWRGRYEGACEATKYREAEAKADALEEAVQCIEVRISQGADDWINVELREVVADIRALAGSTHNDAELTRLRAIEHAARECVAAYDEGDNGGAIDALAKVLGGDR